MTAILIYSKPNLKKGTLHLQNTTEQSSFIQGANQGSLVALGLEPCMTIKSCNTYCNVNP